MPTATSRSNQTLTLSTPLEPARSIAGGVLPTHGRITKLLVDQYLPKDIGGGGIGALRCLEFHLCGNCHPCAIRSRWRKHCDGFLHVATGHCAGSEIAERV